ncbi:MAG: acyl-CoA dehydrogenase [Candidatus Binatia bacterium]|nr:MAG: acyl-CoA dehydrogenase [Candidatus Binatia bacterium]
MAEERTVPVEWRSLGVLRDALRSAVDFAVERMAQKTGKGRGIDEEQVDCERLAYLATEVAAVESLLDYVRAAEEAGKGPEVLREMGAVFAGEVAQKALSLLEVHGARFGIDEAFLRSGLGSPSVRAAVREALSESRVRAVGRHAIETRGENHWWLEPEELALTRDSVREFARREIAPHADRIHRNDELVPDEIVAKMAELGYFGLSVPEEYGGSGMGNPAMIVTTEELSAVSLAAGGSLITRPEILTKALLRGGTERQKRKWLPLIASGKRMVAIAVTEPDVGSDVASVQCRATPAEVGGRKGYVLDGAKAWSTFAGRADILALLARTDPDPSKGARGLSLFIVEKDPFYGHEFVMKQPHGGTITGKADRTPGYRGMHSFTLQFEKYFVPAENVVGEEGGLGKGFYLQMGGFAAGRLQTGGRATGVAQAALERSCEYANDRRQFGRPIGKFPLTEYKVGRMATHVMAARQLTYAAARRMDEDESAALEPAMAKLLASDVAVWVTQEGQLLHGGWGYAEEFPISRYVVDALVLPIFEGVKPILELKVIARALLAR